MPQPIKIDVWSDVACPWCYIGKRRLERALAERPEADLKIGWRPFQLNPDLPREGIPRKEYIERKFGPGGARSYSRCAASTGSNGSARRSLPTTPRRLASGAK